VISWKRRYREEGVGGLDDRAKSGRPREIDEAEIVARTLEAPPEHLGVTHWSSRLLAVELGVSQPFAWTKPADELVARATGGQRTSITRH
jgi:transposase